MHASNLFNLFACSFLVSISLSCGKKLQNSIDPLQVKCGISSEEAVGENQWVFKVFSEGNAVAFMAYNRIKDLSAVAGLKTLKKLTLSFNQIQDISSLSGLTNMEVLYLWGNKVTDILPLAGMNKLQTLYLSDNRVSDISALAGINTLDLFYAPDNRISDISVLGNQKKIRFINLINNPITDLSPLRDLESVQELKLTGTPIDSEVSLTSMRCPIDAKSKVLRDYCTKRVPTPSPMP